MSLITFGYILFGGLIGVIVSLYHNHKEEQQAIKDRKEIIIIAMREAVDIRNRNDDIEKYGLTPMSDNDAKWLLTRQASRIIEQLEELNKENK